jgi:hypothetical protein
LAHVPYGGIPKIGSAGDRDLLFFVLILDICSAGITASRCQCVEGAAARGNGSIEISGEKFGERGPREKEAGRHKVESGPRGGLGWVDPRSWAN